MIGNVFGNYKITEKIGEGGMGSVFKGLDLMLEREVAIKVLRPELAGQAEIVERFRTEAVTLARLNHPRVATLYSFSRHGDLFLMVMEYVRGTTLGDRIERHGAIRPAAALPLFCQALEGIEHAHALGVVHRDLKPGNIMVTDAGSAKVMDFGIARVLGASRLTRAGHLLGTVEYMSPEQVRGQHADTRSDIYSAGIVLYEMLTGRVPFASDSEFELMRAQVEEPPPPPSSLLADIPEAVERAILRALAKRPEGRFASAGEFRAALLEAYDEAPFNLGTRPLATRAARRDDNDTGRDNEAAAPHFDADARETSAPSSRDRAATPSGSHVRGTRLAPDSGGLVHGAHSDFGFVKGDAGFASRPPAGGAGERAPHARKLPSALLSRLDWRHYAGACAALALLLFASVALVGDGGTPDATPKIEATGGRTTEQPAATGPAAAATPETAAETAPTPTPPPPAPPPRPSTFTATEGVRPVESTPRAVEEETTTEAPPKADAKQPTKKSNAPRAKADDRARRRREALRALEQ